MSDDFDVADMSARYAHIFDPIKDLAESWNINLSDDLETYIHDLESIITKHGSTGVTSINFSEAALLIQGSVNIFSRKVDYLHQLMSNSLLAFSKLGSSRNADRNSGPGTSNRRRTPEEALLDDYEPILKSLSEAMRDRYNTSVDRTRSLQNSAASASLSSLSLGSSNMPTERGGNFMVDEVVTTAEEQEIYRLRDGLLTARQPHTLISADTISLIPSTTTPSTGFKISNLLMDNKTGFLLFEDIDRQLIQHSSQRARMEASELAQFLLANPALKAQATTQAGIAIEKFLRTYSMQKQQEKQVPNPLLDSNEANQAVQSMIQELVSNSMQNKTQNAVQNSLQFGSPSSMFRTRHSLTGGNYHEPRASIAYDTFPPDKDGQLQTHSLMQGQGQGQPQTEEERLLMLEKEEKEKLQTQLLESMGIKVEDSKTQTQTQGLVDGKTEEELAREREIVERQEREELARAMALSQGYTTQTQQMSQLHSTQSNIPGTATTTSSLLTNNSEQLEKELVNMDAVKAAKLRWERERRLPIVDTDTFERLDPYISDPSTTRPYTRGRCYIAPKKLVFTGTDPENYLLEEEGIFDADINGDGDDIISNAAGNTNRRHFSTEKIPVDVLVDDVIAAGSKALLGVSLQRVIAKAKNASQYPFHSEFSDEFVEALAAKRALEAFTRRAMRDHITTMRTADIEKGVDASNISLYRELEYSQVLRAIGGGIGAGHGGAALTNATTANTRNQVDNDEEVILNLGFGKNMGAGAGPGVGIGGDNQDGIDTSGITGLGMGLNTDGIPVDRYDMSTSSTGGPSLLLASDTIANLTQIVADGSFMMETAANASSTANSGDAAGIATGTADNLDFYAVENDQNDDDWDKDFGLGTDFDATGDQNTNVRTTSSLAPSALSSELTKLEQSYEELSQQLIQGFLRTARLYVAESNISRRVRDWQEAVEPLLLEQERRGEFDIHKYGQSVIETIKYAPNSKKVAKGKGIHKHKLLSQSEQQSLVPVLPLSNTFAGKPAYEVCRLFLATLQLANAGNVDISFDTVASYEDLQKMHDKLSGTTTSTTSTNAANAVKSYEYDIETTQKSILDPVIAHKNIAKRRAERWRKKRDYEKHQQLLKQQQKQEQQQQDGNATINTSVDTTGGPIVDYVDPLEKYLSAPDSIQLKLLSEKFQFEEDLDSFRTIAVNPADGAKDGQPLVLPPSRQRQAMEAKKSKAKAKAQKGVETKGTTASATRRGKAAVAPTTTKKTTRRKNAHASSDESEAETDGDSEDMNDSFVVDSDDEEAMKPTRGKKKGSSKNITKATSSDRKNNIKQDTNTNINPDYETGISEKMALYQSRSRTQDKFQDDDSTSDSEAELKLSFITQDKLDLQDTQTQVHLPPRQKRRLLDDE